jgi:alpha-galactosidase
MPKIAIIGAGSVVFARRLITDFLTFPALRDSHFALMDIAPESLQIIGDWAQYAIRQSGVGATVQLTADRREALADADYVIVSIRVGGMEVEVPCLVDGTGIHPCYVGDLPSELFEAHATQLPF